MKTIELINTIYSDMQKHNIPVSIINDAFIHSLHPNPNKDEYMVERSEENGLTIIEFVCTSHKTDYKHRLIMDPKNKKYSMTTERITKSNFQTTSYELVTTNLEHTNRSWNNNPGFIVTKDERNTLVDTDRREFVDTLTERKSLYDDNGIEFQEESTVKEFPKREYKGDFIFGVPRNNFRTVIKQYYNLTRREGIDKAINYSQVKDALNNVIRQGESYYHLSNEHGLGTMNFNYGTISKEDYDSIPEKYSEEEVERLISNDFGLTKEALKNIYSISRTM